MARSFYYLIKMAPLTTKVASLRHFNYLMKKIFKLVLPISVLLVSLCACSNKSDSTNTSESISKESIENTKEESEESKEETKELDTSSIMEDISEIESVIGTDEVDSKWYCEEVPGITSFYMNRPITNFYIDNHEYVLGYTFDSFLNNGWEARDFNSDELLNRGESKEFELIKDGKSIFVTVKNIYDEDDFPILSAAFTGIKLDFDPNSYIDFSSPHNIPLGYQVKDWEIESNNLKIDKDSNWVETKNEDGSSSYTLHEEGKKDGWNYKCDITYIFDGRVFIGFSEDFDQWL